MAAAKAAVDEIRDNERALTTRSIEGPCGRIDENSNLI